MSIVVINAIEVPAERADAMAERFANRRGDVENFDGFEEFQLLRPSDDRTRWLVCTRWRDRESFDAWLNSQSFTESHSKAAGPRGPVGTGSEVWSFEVAQHRTAG